ncbi:MAG: 2-oxoglutarate dehydrogenase complex dihydrolipoyllysine-residue succinyltransferase [Gammaproteobacteria bacterium]|nr:2-oxoglutarate dehydrogenase complex dihydrolipoyllysine-residue succinyltransferase [Gammaproteobacteria bacterium]MDH5651149.1 2-oxoglutarate dehydrogenase complex dihydrolipoyllysine-residue succinyltransferase [Gammaproteobacteria bacterium]
MSVEIKVPAFPESISEGTLVKWHKAVGEAVSRDEIVADIETDKVVFEVPALDDGVVEELLESEGATVLSGQIIARIAPGKAASTGKAAKPLLTPVSANDAEVPAISPSAQKLMAEHGLSQKQVQGSGKDGRILKEDVQKAVENKSTTAKPAAAAAPVSLPAGERPRKRVPMSRLRARIAERLVEAQQTAAILTTFNEVNMQPLMELRKRYRDKFEKTHNVRLGYMSFFVKAAVEALKRFPEVNASIEGEDIVYHGFYDIGIAVGSPRGLVVPILRDVDQLGVAAIEGQIADFGNRAKNGSLTLEEITGGTFSITNGGVFGSLLSTPILNPPQSAILGMHKIQERPMVEEGQIVIRPMMYLALSYDHRIIDGREAVQFLVTIKELLEDPARILLEI